MTTEQMLIVAIGALVSALSAMAVWFRTQFLKLEQRAEECWDDREEMWKQIAHMQTSSKQKVARSANRSPRNPNVSGKEPTS